MGSKFSGDKMPGLFAAVFRILFNILLTITCLALAAAVFKAGYDLIQAFMNRWKQFYKGYFSIPC